jgi:hypothetical protein
VEMIDGAFGDVFRGFEHPIYNPIDPANVPADSTTPEHKRIFYRLRNLMLYLRDKQVSRRCFKKVDLTAVFVLLEFVKETKPIRWTRLPNGTHDVAWRKLYRVVRGRLVHYVANVHKVRPKACSCLTRVILVSTGFHDLSEDTILPEDTPPCAEFVYPEYEEALKKAEQESRGPWGYEFDVFMWVRRIVGNDLALKIIDSL